MTSQRFGRYELLAQLGKGGMAEVFVARVVSALDGVDKIVVVKRLLPEHAGNQEFVDMFLDEARTAASLNHPNVVQMYDCGVEAGRHYIAMEYLHGEDVRGITRALRSAGRPLPLSHALQITAAICAGLHHAHEAVDRSGKPLGIVHRDVSPHNVLVTFDGAVRVVDFGIAKSANRKSATRHGTLKGKVPYMSPEQLRGEASLDRRSDVYAVGVMLYEMLLGQRPYARSGTGEFALMVAIARGDIRPPSSIDPSFPRPLERIIMKALAREPSARYATARAMQEDIENLARAESLDLGPTSLGKFMRELFGERVEAWRSAQQSPEGLVAHVVASVEERHEASDGGDDEPEIESGTAGATESAEIAGSLEAVAAPDGTTTRAVARSFGVDASARELSGVWFWTLSGRLSESFEGAALGNELKGTVVLDLGGVERVTSFGVREWLAMLDSSRRRVETLFLARCSEAFVNQLSMIRTLAGDARIASFFAPYVCGECGRPSRHLVDCERDAEAIRTGRLPEVPCPSCGGLASLDDDPRYLACLAPHAGRALPEPVRLVLDATARDALAEAEVEKSVQGDVTTIRVRKPLDRSLRWPRIFDGVEGRLVVDLRDAGRATPEGARGLAQALRGLSPEIAALSLEGIPASALALLDRMPERVDVRSISFEGRCPGCDGPRGSLVSPRELREALGSGSAPSFPCSRCSTPLERVDAGASLKVLFPGSAPAPASPQPSPPKPLAPPTEAAPPASPPRAFLMLAAASAVVVIAVATAALALRPPASASTLAPAASPAVSSAPPASSPAPSLAAEAPSAASPRLDGDQVVLTTSGAGASDEDALAQARASAVAQLAELALGRLKDESIRAFIKAKLPASPAPAPSAVAARWLRHVGAVATPDRVEARFARSGGVAHVTARYALKLEALDRAAAVFAASTSMGGARLALAFPLLPAAGDGGEVLVVDVAPASPAARAGVRVGDAVETIDARPVPSLDAALAVLRAPPAARSVGLLRGRERIVVDITP